MKKNIDYSEVYDYFDQLSDESKINFSKLIFDNGIDKILKTIQEHFYNSISEFILDSELEDDDYTDLNEIDEDSHVEDIFNLKDKNQNDIYPVHVIFEDSKSSMHVFSNSEEDSDRFIYENMFLKGMVFFKSETDIESIKEDNERYNLTKKYSKYDHYMILGQLEQDICYN